MDLPDDIDFPFFTYGIFKPGQISHFRLEDLIDRSESATVSGKLWDRDGIPLLETLPSEPVEGELLWFRSEDAETAYEQIGEVEPDTQYEWDCMTAVAESGKYDVNVLAGLNPPRGGQPLQNAQGVDLQEWNGQRDDPLFNEALEVIEDTLEQYGNPEYGDLKSFFQLQMAYLLLWSVIERYISLRYGFTGKIWKRREKFAKNEKAFETGLREVAESRDGHKLYRADDPEITLHLDRDDPVESIHYYYQVRNNIVHRGKAVQRDFWILESSLRELYTIVSECVLPAAFDG